MFIQFRQKYYYLSLSLISEIIMKKSIVIPILMLFVMNVHASDWSGNANFILGTKSLENSDWGTLDEQLAVGVLVDFKQKNWPISMAIDLLGSLDEEDIPGGKREGSTSEFDIGVRKIWEVSGSSIRPFIGGGIAFIDAEQKLTNGISVSVDDSATGVWLNGGVYWTLGQHFNLGLQARYSKAEVTLAGIDVEAGGTIAAIMLGYHW
jgi:opacity protein-like surface antigen